MAITVSQFTAFGAWTGTLGAAASTGDTLFYITDAYSVAGAAMSSSAPVYNGSTPAGAVKLIEKQSALGVGSVYTATWLVPVPTGGGAGTVGITMSGQDTPGDNHTCGLTVIDTAGLTSPALDQSNSQTGTNNQPTTGASGNITETPEIVIGSLFCFGNLMSEVGAPWTETQLSDQFQVIGYQIITSGSASYTYTQTAGNSGAWTGTIVTVGSASSGVTVNLPVAQLALAAPVPTVQFPATVNLPVAQLALAAPVVTPAGSGSATVALPVAQLTLAAPVPLPISGSGGAVPQTPGDDSDHRGLLRKRWLW